ncbi:MAG: hypothetical protein IPH88_19395 [Bacteroidales bacterium]|nr:hypothetical protein [Bacteroidales bacterium]
MKTKLLSLLIFIICFASVSFAQDQGFFLNQWQPLTIASPTYSDVVQTTDPVNVSLKVLFNDTITRVPQYVFGDNANLWSGCMSDNQVLMQHMINRKMTVLRGPAGSVLMYISGTVLPAIHQQIFLPSLPDKHLPLSPGTVSDQIPGKTGPWRRIHFIAFSTRLQQSECLP